MLGEIDARTRLTRRQKLLVTVATSAVALEFLDYFLIGFILVFVQEPWDLGFGRTSVILLSSGLGAVLGAVYFGRLADRIGRRRVFLTTISIFTAATAALALTPDDPSIGWIYLAALRLVVGFGAGGLYVVDLPLVQEFTPKAMRGRVTGLVTSAVPLGFLIGSLLVWLVSDAIGWRGILLLAAVLGVVLLLARTAVPESPRYLIGRGDVDGARRSIAWALDVDPAGLPDHVDDAGNGTGPSTGRGFRDLAAYPRSLVASTLSNLGAQTGYYGLSLWTPTLLVLVVGIAPSQTGMYMAIAMLGALAGRFAFSYLAETIGRRRAGALAGFGAAATLMLAASTGDATIGGVSAFFVVMVVVYVFGEGGFAVVGPYAGEVWPSRLRTTGMGFAYGIGGIGTVIGPLGLGLILGAGTTINPQASELGLLPGFAYFAGWYLLAALAFVVVGIETKGRSLEQLDREIEAQRRDVRGIGA